MKVDFKVEGLRDIEEMLFELKSSTAKGQIRTSMKKSLEPMKLDMVRKAPVNQGTLRDSITITSRVRPREAKRSDVEMFLGPGPLRQAAPQEFGSFKHRGKPFIRPAFDNNSNLTIKLFKEIIGERVNKALQRHRRKAARMR